MKKIIKKVSTKCTWCESIIERYPSRIKKNGTFCSVDCRNKARLQKIKTSCKYCSKEYEVVRKDLKYSEFCSIECRDKYYKKTCVFCGELFEEETGAFYTKNFEEERILNSFGVKNIYCSWTCFFEYKSGKKIVFCQTCGGKIKKHNPEKNKRYFCNSKCVGKLHSKVMKLKNITGDTYQNSRELLDRPLTLTSLTREVEQC